MFGALAGRAFGNAPRHDVAQRLHLSAGHHMDVPGLKIAARGRASGQPQDAAQLVHVDRPVRKAAYGAAGFDGFAHVHRGSPRLARLRG